jgi:hypothetical protein
MFDVFSAECSVHGVRRNASEKENVKGNKINKVNIGEYNLLNRRVYKKVNMYNAQDKCNTKCILSEYI